MPWQTPTLKDVRSLVRDNIRGSLPGADALVPNSVLRVLSDSQGALCHLTLQYIDWLALQLIPDTAETEWLDRHGDIWLVNADGTTGRKLATLSGGTVNITAALPYITIPIYSQLSAIMSGTGGGSMAYETLQEIVTAPNLIPVPCQVRALDPGTMGNLNPGDTMSFNPSILNVQDAVVVIVDGGTDTETDDELRVRVLERIRQPPMGGAANDYVRWAKGVAGVTRAWCMPLEMGIGTVTVRFLMDDLRASNDGWPNDFDIATVQAYLDSVRPVAVKDFFVVAPIKQFINVSISNLVPDNDETRAAIEQSLLDMLFNLAKPGQTIFAVWKAQAIMNTANVMSFDLGNWTDDVMPSIGNMAVLGDIIYG
jgi:uncharacterized phage protein gp47/JayE